MHAPPASLSSVSGPAQHVRTHANTRGTCAQFPCRRSLAIHAMNIATPHLRTAVTQPAITSHHRAQEERRTQDFGPRADVADGSDMSGCTAKSAEAANATMRGTGRDRARALPRASFPTIWCNCVNVPGARRATAGQAPRRRYSRHDVQTCRHDVGRAKAPGLASPEHLVQRERRVGERTRTS